MHGRVSLMDKAISIMKDIARKVMYSVVGDFSRYTPMNIHHITYAHFSVSLGAGRVGDTHDGSGGNDPEILYHEHSSRSSA